jgi:glycosyltransferase involved in cell wall biosynthesis
MSSIRPASVIIDSYNYARFLPEAIESALAQTYPNLEVIVVDDGSRDDSRDVIARYQGRVTAVLKDNGGQASALNAGFRASQGEVICFLDSDDSLSATAVAQAVDLAGPDVAKVHWPLWVVDAEGRRTGKQMPQKELPDGDLRATVLRDGPWSYATPPHVRQRLVAHVSRAGASHPRGRVQDVP